MTLVDVMRNEKLDVYIVVASNVSVVSLLRFII